MTDPSGLGTVALLLERLIAEVQGLRAAVEITTKMTITAGSPGAETGALLDVKGAAAHCAVSTTTIYRASERGELRCMKAGARVRFARADLDSWLRGERPEAARVLSLDGKKGL